MSKVLKLNNDYLDVLIGLQSKKLVGKSMKRFEILPSPEAIKSAVKELIYESYRDFKDLIIAHDAGRNVTIFKFTTQKDSPAT